MNHEHQSKDGSWLGSRRGVLLLVFLAIVGSLLFTPVVLLLRSRARGFAGHARLRDELSSISKWQLPLDA